MGMGPAAIPIKQLTADRLAAAIRTAVTGDRMHARVALLSAKIHGEDGVGNAVSIIERVVAARGL